MPHLSPEENLLLNALLDRIVPADDFPGAVEAGVPTFIEGRFEADPATVETYRAALMLLEARDFVNQTTAAQDAILAELGGHPMITPIIQHALEGYYAGPNSVGAQMVGFRVTV